MMVHLEELPTTVPTRRLLRSYDVKNFNAASYQSRPVLGPSSLSNPDQMLV